MHGRLVTEESGLALALAIIMNLLINCTNYNHLMVRFSATLGQEPEVKLALP